MTPANPPQGLSGGDITHSTDAVCRITATDGTYGIGLARGASLPEICQVIMNAYAPVLIGEDPIQTEYLWQKMHAAGAGRYPEGVYSTRVRAFQAAQAALDIALWDIKGKAANQSVCELLGGKPHDMPAYLSKCFYVKDQSDDDMLDEALTELRSGGYTHMKMRAGRYGVDDAVHRVRIVREALGSDFKIGLDINQAFDTAQTLELLKRLEPYDMMWVEEPLCRIPKGVDVATPHYNWDVALGRLADQTVIPISSGENHFTLKDCLSLVHNGKIKYMQFDVTKNGGVTEWMKVAAICEAYGVLMAPHHVPQFHVQLAAAVPHGFIIECYDNKRQHPAWPDLFEGYPETVGGMIPCQKGPGWGMDVNGSFLQKNGHAVNWAF
jgi:L-alanine-DL-glutamate epimerase-like enolase superfamily enzyme